MIAAERFSMNERPFLRGVLAVGSVRNWVLTATDLPGDRALLTPPVVKFHRLENGVVSDA
ncbi:hypothetical protein [Sphingomonas nostoxanthinifaciens]|uniref:hypothetical protein n=1 Tax=Sphingomonas nostoxanthinifaciens TaxID=2872652 RepID=UPI001CC1C44F|nr:hypothetical protein [Sphingomonas nostoxanthinifaciens]UAK23791.1 hypothetical protein K8P63_15610 [Sphingomonas nostoxanthinifaciens]